MAGRFFVVLAAAVPLLSCATPTQVTVVITTDVECERFKGASVTVGTVDTIEKKPESSWSEPTTCVRRGNVSEIGQIVLIPKADKNDNFAVMVIGGVDTQAKACRESGDYTGCIVARRSLNFIPKTELHLPIHLSSSCEGVPCFGKPISTCVLGGCFPATIEDPEVCSASGACDEDVLAGPDNLPPQPPTAACGRPSAIIDDFKGESVGQHWRTENPMIGGGTVSQAAGELTLTPPMDAAAPTEVRLVSNRTVNLSSDAITVQVPKMLNTASGARAYLAAEIGPNRVMIEQKNGLLRFVSTDGGDGMPIEKSKAYDPKAHLWWEIRATTSSIVMLTSPNGINWEEGITFARPAFADAVHIVLGAGVDGPVESPGSVAFDNLNQNRPQAPWCPINKLSDDFDTELPLPQWSVENSDNTCSITQGTGNLILQIPAGVAATCAYRSRTAYDLTSNSIVLDVQELANVLPDMTFFLGATDDAGRLLQIGVQTDKFGAPSFFAVQNAMGGALTEGEAMFDQVPKLLRIREDKGNIYFDMMPPGAAMWSDPLLTVARNMTVEAVHVSIHFQTFVALGQPITAKVGSLNR